YTESYQAVYHEHMLKMIAERPYLWATHVWNLFDFAADGRDEGGKNGENQKGLVTFDRSLKKDAFYLYKAAWNKNEPFVHLCGSRYVNRAEAQTQIKAYSNCPVVTLYVDGQEAGCVDNTGAAPGTENIFLFTVSISGEHEITACAGEGITDTIRICKVDQDDPAYIFGEKKTVVNWFDQGDLDPEAFSVQDTLGALRAHPQAGAVVNAMMAKASAARGDVAESVKDNPALQKMMAKMTLISLLKQAGADEETVKNLNRVLQAIRKDS
ncbi:MAG: glycoside hydrolase family 2 protein, partial [Lachnospiraceae bacterium]|nr:glycoside hydrolase family 2 protein [Lachnospiraceae bacterium]